MAGLHATQIINVTLTLAGEQGGRIDAHHAGTSEARLTVLWGSLMLTLTNPAQATHLHDVWQRAALLARALPQWATPQPDTGLDARITTAGVVSTLWGLPRWDVRFVGDATTGGHRTPRHVAVRVGGITWHAHDRVSAASTAGLFVRAQALAPTVLKAWPEQPTT